MPETPDPTAEAIALATARSNGLPRSAYLSETIPPGFVTGEEIQDALGITKEEFRVLAKKGLITRHSRRGSKGSKLYLREDMEKLVESARALRRRDVRQEQHQARATLFEQHTQAVFTPVSAQTAVPYSAVQGADVFARLHEGKSLPDIVLETGYHPAVVHAISRDYYALGDQLVIPKDMLEKINALPLPGTLPVTRAQHIYSLLLAFASDRKCKHCNSGRTCLTACKPCAAAAFARAAKAKADADEGLPGDQAADDGRLDEPVDADSSALRAVANGETDAG